MKAQTFTFESTLPCSPRDLWEWHERPYAFSRIMPPWENTVSDRREHRFNEKDEISFHFRLGPLRYHWNAIYEDILPGKQFCDRQLKGPFPYWKHTHLFESLSEGSTTQMKDSVIYQLPFEPLGTLLAGYYVHRRLRRMFHYRHYLLAKEMRFFKQQASLRIAVTGASGLLAKTLIPLLSTRGHQVFEVTRSTEVRADHIINWDPQNKKIDLEKLSTMDAVIHLAGESITGYWSKAKKERILGSRVEGTRFLVDSLKACSPRPKTLLSASAIGFYGDRPNQILTESSSKGTGFLADVCQAWEEEARRAETLGIRTVPLRIGMVLSPKGGALSSMILPFWCGLGGNLGSGKQHMSWIDIEDLCSLIYEILINSNFSEPVNAVAPKSVRNADFTKALAKALNRPAYLPLPAPALRLLLGEMANELMLADCQVFPDQSLKQGFQFEFPTLAQSLDHLRGSYFDESKPLF